MNKPLTWVAIIAGVAFLGLAYLYSTTQAGMLPAYVPGYEAGSAVIHFKHGLGALILGFALLTFVWFQSGPRKI